MVWKVHICCALARVAIEISFRKIPRNRLGTVFVIPRNKVLIPCDSEYFGRVHSVTRNETEFREILKFKEAANKSNLFPKFFSSENDLERNSEVLSVPKMIRTGIPRFFFFRKWFGTEFRGFSQPKMVQNGIPRVFSSEKWFGTEFRWIFSPKKWFRTEFPWSFSFENWFGTKFREFFSSKK